MGKWIALSFIILSGSVLAYLYIELQTTQLDTEVIAPPQSVHAIRVTHSFKDGIHRFVGEVKLPHSCYELTLDENPSHQKDPKKFTIILTSTDRMLDQRLCAKISTRYPFEAIIDKASRLMCGLGRRLILLR